MPSLSSALPPLVADFIAHLGTQRTASRALDLWCRARFPDEGDLPVRVRVLSDRPLAPAEARRCSFVAMAPEEELRYRRVEIRRGARLLSCASNLYLPGRLPAGAAAELRGGERPFGLILEDRGPVRRILGLRARQGAFALTLDAEMALGAAAPVAVLRESYAATLFAPAGG